MQTPRNQTLAEALYRDIDKNDYLKEIYESLLYDYSINLFKLRKQQKEINIKDALRFADLLAKSTLPDKRDEHRLWGQELVILLSIVYPEDLAVRYYLGSVLSTVGNYRGLKSTYIEGFQTSNVFDGLYFEYDKSRLQIPGEGLLNGRRNGAEINLKRVAAYCRVSTDSEDQLQSYHSQVKYYTGLINENPDWTMAGIYADEAITGTQIDKRLDFQRLINDCMNGDIDMIITKSISRFARNTLDTLKYVRRLKEINVAVFFEEENINTLTMDGELLLVILSSVAQQEVENISANVKKGLKMKMQRGELVGFHGCLGYDYDKESKTISINEDEAEVVRYIFKRYLEGAGGSVICRELEKTLDINHQEGLGSGQQPLS